MNIISRFISELFKPSLKCERLGEHKIVVRTSRKFFKCWKFKELYPDELHSFFYHAIAVQAKIEETYCRRCGTVLASKVLHSHGLNSLSMPTDEMDILREEGVVGA